MTTEAALQGPHTPPVTGHIALVAIAPTARHTPGCDPVVFGADPVGTFVALTRWPTLVSQCQQMLFKLMGFHCSLTSLVFKYYMMKHGKKAIVWFNGPSATDLHHIPRQHTEIGCNFIEQHRSVHHVCAYDSPVLEAIQPKMDVQYWTRAQMVREPFRLTPSDVAYSCSGTMALRLAVHLGLSEIYVIGCDWEHTNHSLYDSAYTWRKYFPRKFTMARRRTLEATAQSLRVNMVSQRGMPYQGTHTVKPADFLEIIN